MPLEDIPDWWCHPVLWSTEVTLESRILPIGVDISDEINLICQLQQLDPFSFSLWGQTPWSVIWALQSIPGSLEHALAASVQWSAPSTLTLRLLSAVGVFWVPMWIYATKHLCFILHLQSCLFFFLPSFFFSFFFGCEPFLKSLLTLLQYCLCFLFWFFGYEACGILPPQSVIEPVPPTLEGKVLTTGLSGKSLELPFSYSPFWLCCVFVAAWGLSLIAASRLTYFGGFFCWGVRALGIFSSCGWHMACGIF